MTLAPSSSTRRLLGAGLMLLLAASAVPARAETLRLSLAAAIERALYDGTAAQLARLEVERAGHEVDRARAALRPRLEGSLGYSNQSLNFETFGFVFPGFDPLVPPFYVIDARLGASLDIIAIAARRRLEAARHGVALSDAERRSTENEVAAAVASLYVAVLATRAQIDERAANVSLFERIEASTRRQLDAGVATRVDLTRSQVQLASQRDALLAARNQESRARLAFLEAIGAPLDAEPELTDPLLDRQGVAMPLEQALAAARARRPDLVASAERLRVAESELGSVKARRLPTLALQALGEYSGNYFNNLLWTRAIGLQMTVPFDTSRAIASAEAEAQVRVEELRVEQHDRERKVEREVRDALLSYQAARSRVELADENRRLAGEELEHARDRFENGVSNALELDNAQTNVTAAADRQVAALFAQAQAWFDVERATGAIADRLPAPSHPADERPANGQPAHQH